MWKKLQRTDHCNYTITTNDATTIIHKKIPILLQIYAKT